MALSHRARADLRVDRAEGSRAGSTAGPMAQAFRAARDRPGPRIFPAGDPARFPADRQLAADVLAGQLAQALRSMTSAPHGPLAGGSSFQDNSDLNIRR